ncbi:hypothetical protein L1889_01325 [Paenalcaligenes niemegkensis]|uniref:hypothetical protein n=1 Tax=Paenalcaligenes niemegkensis TaxID=2895469 RepID=UPI001EE837DD|nr:hypothetical protein [Paenalcaligenes niemegkensis]MCQ9615526.1 hypothetical protein [Paenalcaligenes niemegkensis]
MPIATLKKHRSITAVTTLILGVLVAGCAQQPVAPSPNAARDSTITDAQNKARGRDQTLASSQVQVGFGENAKAEHERTVDRAVIESRQVRELLEARTFLGTIACSDSNVHCVPLRTTLTTAPSGIWRMKIEPVGGSAEVQHAAGCWHPVGTEPTRIILQTRDDVTVAELSFLNDRQMRVNTFNQVRPTLETLLSRQADIDPIPELDNAPAPVCTSF